VDVEVCEEVVETNVRTLRATDTSLLRHLLCIYDLDDGAVAEQIDTECTLDLFKLVLDSMTHQDDWLERSIAYTWAHERVDENLLRFLLRDELASAEMELLGISSTGEVVAQMRVRRDAGVGDLYASQNVLGMDGRSLSFR